MRSNQFVAESCVLPWHAIDALVGPNGAALRELESAHHVTCVLPGQDIASEEPMLGNLFLMASSMTLRGRKKHVEAAAAAVDAVGMAHQSDAIQLSDEEAELLAGLCLEDDTTLELLGERATRPLL